MNTDILKFVNETFKGKKTYITSIATVLITVGNYLLGDITFVNASYLVLGAIYAGTFRSGMKTEAEKIAN